MEALREQLLSEAKSEVLKYENKADLAENCIRGLKGQIESEEMDIGRFMEGCAYSRRQQDLLHEELTDREPALRDTQNSRNS